MTACLLYAKIHKNKAENLLHLMLYFSERSGELRKGLTYQRFFAILLSVIRLQKLVGPAIGGAPAGAPLRFIIKGCCYAKAIYDL